MMRILLWDIDGTLLLSESMHFRALRDALATEGLDVPDEFHHEIVGRAAPKRPAWLVYLDQ